MFPFMIPHLDCFTAFGDKSSTLDDPAFGPNKTSRGELCGFLMKVNIPVESGNAAAKAGKLGETIQSILADLKPEAVYFTDNNGQRSAFIFLEMQDASQIPANAEPWFLAFNASIEIHPVMVPDDLARASDAIEKAVKKYA